MSDEPNWDTLEADLQISNTENAYNKAMEIVATSLEMHHSSLAVARRFKNAFADWLEMEGVDTTKVDWNYLVQGLERKLIK